jgi:hypothetical protein
MSSKIQCSILINGMLWAQSVVGSHKDAASWVEIRSAMYWEHYRPLPGVPKPKLTFNIKGAA